MPWIFLFFLDLSLFSCVVDLFGAFCQKWKVEILSVCFLILCEQHFLSEMKSLNTFSVFSDVCLSTTLLLLATVVCCVCPQCQAPESSVLKRELVTVRVMTEITYSYSYYRKDLPCSISQSKSVDRISSDKPLSGRPKLHMRSSSLMWMGTLE